LHAAQGLPPLAAAAIAHQRQHRQPTRRRLLVDVAPATEILRTTLAQRRIPSRIPVQVVVPAPRVFATLPQSRRPTVDMEQRSFQRSMSAQVASRQQWEADTAHARISDAALWPQYGMHMLSVAQIHDVGGAALQRSARRWTT
jgi:hypothetical protein